MSCSGSSTASGMQTVTPSTASTISLEAVEVDARCSGRCRRRSARRPSARCRPRHRAWKALLKISRSPPGTVSPSGPSQSGRVTSASRGRLDAVDLLPVRRRRAPGSWCPSDAVSSPSMSLPRRPASEPITRMLSGSPPTAFGFGSCGGSADRARSLVEATGRRAATVDAGQEREHDERDDDDAQDDPSRVVAPPPPRSWPDGVRQ